MDDHKDPDDSIYYLRSKKRKLENGEEATCSYTNENTCKRKNVIMMLPLEILEHVFQFITYQELSETVRKVNRKFKLAAENLLNTKFKNLSKQIQNLKSATLRAIEVTEDDMEVKCLCRLLNLLDIINIQQGVIEATIWRYVYNDYYTTQKTCMYGGKILDLFDQFLNKFTTRPYQIYGPAVVRDYAVPEDVKHLIRLTKNFCIHFDKINEEPIKHALSSSSCKIVDLLDCAPFASKTVIYERANGDTFSAKYCYYLHNAWFLTFRILPDKEMSVQQRQRMMHMRIRRIILAHTEMFLQQHQYERETLMRPNAVIRRPGVVAYTGYGEVQDTFFCYGAMNDAAYLQKYHSQDNEQDQLVDNEIHNDIVPNLNELNEEDDFSFIPHLGLDIDIQIDCPLAYAPHKYIIKNQELVRKAAHSLTGMFNFCVEFNFPGAYYIKLPTGYRYQKRRTTRRH